MTTEKQIEANRENALKSTGPTSTEDKLRASKNAMKHGILSKNLVVSGEKISEYQAFRQNLIETLHPEGTMEDLLVEKIACLVGDKEELFKQNLHCFIKVYLVNGIAKALKAFFKVERVIAFKIFHDMKQILKRTSIGHCIS